MKMVRNVFLLIGFIFLNSLYAQHSAVTAVLQRCQNYYGSHPNLQFELYYKMYDSYTSTKLIEEMDGSILTANGNVQVKLGTQLQLLTDNYAIVTDENTKTIAVQERMSKKQTTPLGLDSLIGLFGETKVLSETDELITLSFAKPRPKFYTVSKFTIDFQKETGRVEKVVLYYAFDLNQFYEQYETQTIPRIEILYQNYSESNVEPGAFSESKFFENNNNKLKPVNAYKGYKLIDLRSLNDLTRK